MGSDPRPSNPAPSSIKLIEQLTAREKEITELVIDGLTNIEIARRLYVSDITVKKHLGNIYQKLGISGKNQLIQKMLKE